MKLSIVIPCYNESKTLAEVLQRVLQAPPADVTKEILVVDDGSKDESVAIAQQFVREFPQTVRLLRQPRNRGKGEAVRRGIAEATGDIVLIQDADLEYDPNDYPALLEKFNDPSVKVVYGSRILGSTNYSYHRYYWGGRLITWATNLIYGCRISDEPTCYKLFRREILCDLELQCRGFEFCPEVTAKVLRRGYKIHEVPIHYHPRSFAEGKKISWRDGLIALWTLLKYRTWK